jgi:hypothetical protein
MISRASLSAAAVKNPAILSFSWSVNITATGRYFSRCAVMYWAKRPDNWVTMSGGGDVIAKRDLHTNLLPYIFAPDLTNPSIPFAWIALYASL